MTNLVNKWSSVTFQPTSTTLSSLPSTVVHGQPANFTVSVTSGSGTPTGDLSLITQNSITNQIQTFGSFTLASNGTFSGSVSELPGGTLTYLPTMLAMAFAVRAIRWPTPLPLPGNPV